MEKGSLLKTQLLLKPQYIHSLFHFFRGIVFCLKQRRRIVIWSGGQTARASPRHRKPTYTRFKGFPRISANYFWNLPKIAFYNKNAKAAKDLCWSHNMYMCNVYVCTYVDMPVYVYIFPFSRIYHYDQAKQNAKWINLPSENVHIDQPGPATDGFTFSSMT